MPSDECQGKVRGRSWREPMGRMQQQQLRGRILMSRLRFCWKEQMSPWFSYAIGFMFGFDTNRIVTTVPIIG
ncbi:hypothetical protein CRYUN_Cryun05aG0177400 [Craigia yunnanensis]